MLKNNKPTILIVLSIVLLISSSISYAKLLDLNTNLDDETTLIGKESKRELPKIQTCEDLDKDNIFTSSYINITKGNKSITLNDSCKDNSILLELTCLKNEKKEIEFECEYGCFEGKCLTCEESEDCGLDGITGETVLDECSDGTLLNQCNLEGYRCVDLELVEDPSCILDSPPEYTDGIYIGEINYIYSKDELTGKKFDSDLYYLVNDYLGNLRLILEDTGDVIENYDYYPYGKSIDEGLNERFTGKEYDHEIELYNYGARYYDPDTGRFTAQDPIIKGDKGNYEYANNNPLRFVDPDGRDVVDRTSQDFKNKYPDLFNNIQKHYAENYMTLHLKDDIKVYLFSEYRYLNKEINNYFKKNPDHFAFTKIESGDKVAKIYFNPKSLSGTVHPILIESSLNHELIHGIMGTIEKKIPKNEFEKLQYEVETYTRNIKDDNRRLANENDPNQRNVLNIITGEHTKSKTKREQQILLIKFTNALGGLK